MWILVILFLPIAILLVNLQENNKKENSNKEYEDLAETLQNLEDECKEINNLICEIEECETNAQKETKQALYYNDAVTEEEIQQSLKNIQDDGLTEDEIVFLKFMNNKEIYISFSPRWEFQYEIKPRILVAKLLKLKYLTYSSWYDNVKSATIKELKEVLKSENLKILGNKQELVKRVLENVDANILKETFNKGKYILTDKGKEIIEKHKYLFMSNKEMAGEDFTELTDYEYEFLEELGQIQEYARLKKYEISFEKGYNKNDVLWSIYNVQKEKMVLK